MTNKLLVALAPFTALVAGPALACGHSAVAVNDLQLRILTASMVAAPLLAALLVDRGAFALAAFATGLKRRHRPSALGPVLAMVAVVIALSSVGAHDLNLAVVGFAFVPVAAVVCGLSFLRSVRIDLRGRPGPQLLRVGAFVAFALIALARLFL
jgi:hypothetical protein